MLVLTCIICFHFICDFIFQFDKHAKNKNHSIKALLAHTSSYTAQVGALTVVLLFLIHDYNAFHYIIALSFWLFVMHTVTDFTTSKITAYAHKTGKIKLFWGVIGIDQMLHMLQIIYLYETFLKG